MPTLTAAHIQALRNQAHNFTVRQPGTSPDPGTTSPGPTGDGSTPGSTPGPTSDGSTGGTTGGTTGATGTGGTTGTADGSTDGQPTGALCAFPTNPQLGQSSVVTDASGAYLYTNIQADPYFASDAARTAWIKTNPSCPQPPAWNPGTATGVPSPHPLDGTGRPMPPTVHPQPTQAGVPAWLIALIATGAAAAAVAVGGVMIMASRRSRRTKSSGRPKRSSRRTSRRSAR